MRLMAVQPIHFQTHLFTRLQLHRRTSTILRGFQRYKFHLKKIVLVYQSKQMDFSPDIISLLLEYHNA